MINMFCLFCLRKLNECVEIFNYPNWNEEFGVAEIITKYFGIKVNIEDRASNKICNTCWKHLDDFYKFWLFVKEKQKIFLELANVKSDPLEGDQKKEPTRSERYDKKNVQCHDLSIINESSFVKAELNSEEIKITDLCEEIELEKDELTLDDETGDDSDYIPKSTPRQLRHRKRCLPHKSKNRSLVKKQRKVSSEEQVNTEDNTKLICEVCNKVSANKNALKQHMYRRHPTELDLKYSCDLCVKKFAKKYILEQHLNWHRTGKRNTCETCKKGFCNKQELKAHKKSEHADVFQIICDSCGKGFKTKTGYSYHYKHGHLNSIRPEAPEAQCQICKEWLKNERSLSQHMYKHRDESSGKDFVCKICGAVKSTKKRLSRHREYHHPKKIHKCTLCNKEFKIALALQEHVAAVHTGQPLYSCSFCPQTFKSNGNMYTHKKKVHPNEWVPKKISATKKCYVSE